MFQKRGKRMKDIYFSDKSKKYDTGKIPLTDIERQRQEEINRRRYQEIVRKQQQHKTSERRTEYDPYELEGYQEENYRRTRTARYQPNSDTDYNNYNVPRQKPMVQRIYKEQPPQEPVKKQKKKRGCGCSSFLLSFILIFAILCGGTFGYVYYLCSKTDYVKTPLRTEAYNVTSDPQVYNILLIGSDKANDDGSTRSDSMILLSIDSKNKMLKFTSFMRDMWVTIPNYGNAKLNAAYAYGGAPLLMDTIEKNFKVKIDNYITVNFDMFEALIDGLGGVDVDITEAEADFINRTTHAKVSAGPNRLNGDYALIYCRIRKLDSDFNRTYRQRKVMASIFNRAAKRPFSLLFSADDVLENISTDISPMKMTVLSFGAIRFLTYSYGQMRIPLDNGYYDEMIDGQAALVIDFDANIKAIQNFIYE